MPRNSSILPLDPSGAPRAPLAVAETEGSNGKGDRRGGGSPTRRAARSAVLQPAGRKMGIPRRSAPLGALPLPARGASALAFYARRERSERREDNRL
jgi:hypothetical protein